MHIPCITIHFDASVPPSVATEVRAVLLRFAWAFARSIDTVHVRMDDLREGGTTTNVELQYHRATVRLSADWLSRSRGDREAHLLHEMAHWVIEPVAEAVDLLWARLTPAQRKSLRTLRPTLIDAPLERLCEELARIAAASAASTPPSPTSE